MDPMAHQDNQAEKDKVGRKDHQVPTWDGVGNMKPGNIKERKVMGKLILKNNQCENR